MTTSNVLADLSYNMWVLQLPTSAWDIILKRLSLSEIVNLSYGCKELHRVTREEIFVRSTLKR